MKSKMPDLSVLFKKDRLVIMGGEGVAYWGLGKYYFKRTPSIKETVIVVGVANTVEETISQNKY